MATKKKPLPKKQPQSKAVSLNDCLFSYHDGSRDRKVDAWKVAAALQEHQAEIDACFKANDPASIAKAVGYFRDAFGLQEYSEESGQGLTILQQLEIAYHFLDYLGSEKKSIS